MTLYLAGKSKENTLIFASDGRMFYGNQNKIRSETKSKINEVGPGLISCSSGLDSYSSALESKLRETYQQTSQSIWGGNVPKKTAITTLTKEIPALEARLREMAVPDEDDDVANCHLFGLYSGKVMAMRVKLTSKGVSHDLYDEEMKMFPIRSGGLIFEANQDILRAALTYGTKYSSSFLKSLFLYIIEKNEQKGMGGQIFIGELSDRGYSLIADDERLDVELQAETIKQKLSNFERAIEPRTIRSSSTMLLEAGYALNHPAAIYNQAFVFLVLYDKGETKYFKHASALYEAVSMAKMHPHFNLRDSSFVHIMMGDVYTQLGDKHNAANAYNTVLMLAERDAKNQNPEYFGQERCLFSLICAQRGLMNVNPQFRKEKESAFNQWIESIVESGAYTKEQLENVRIGIAKASGRNK